MFKIISLWVKQIKIIARYTTHLYEWLKIQNTTTNIKRLQNAVKEAEQLKHSTNTYWWQCKMVQPLQKNVLEVSYEVKPILTIRPSYNKKKKAYVHTNVYRSFIHNSQKLQQLKHSLTGEWVYKLLYFHTVKYYSTRKRNRFQIQASCSETRHKRLHTVWVHLYNILRKAKL